MEGKHVAVGEALRFGWNTFKEHAWFLVGAMLVGGVLISVPYFLSLAVLQKTYLLGVLCWLVYFVVSLVVGIGFMKIALKLVDGEKPELNDLWNHTNLLPRYAAGTLLYCLIVMGGMLLLIVPGVIWAIKYYFTPYLLVDKNMKPGEALQASAAMTDGIKLDLFGMLIVVALVAMLGYLLLFVGLFVTVPVAMLAIAYTYRMLGKQMQS